jgi:3'(2'), 5'-bisphosphate nucleotidase
MSAEGCSFFMDSVFKNSEMKDEKTRIRKVFCDIVNVILPIIQKYRHEIQNLEVKHKKNHTLLTEADIAVQKAVVEIIWDHDPACQIIAEEDIKPGILDSNSTDQYTWIVDPIDGTREFISSKGKEFCTAVCLMFERMPIGAMVLLPELGHKSRPLLIEATSHPSQIFLNGTPIAIPPTSEKDIPKKISATRSHGRKPYLFESQLAAFGCTLKTRTTSQTIDLLRVATDLSAFTEPPMDSFDLFYREKQKLWDGAPGIFLNYIAGRVVVNENGQSIIPFSEDILDQSTPVLPITVVGPPKYVNWFLALCSKTH